MSLDFVSSYGPEAVNTALPLGGLGAGMVAFAHNGSLESVAVKHHPDMFNDPVLFASVHCKQHDYTRVIQGQVPYHKVLQSHGAMFSGAGSGRGNHFGLPCFSEKEYKAGFPFAELDLKDGNAPVTARITAWSPFIPGDTYNSSLPMGVLEYELTNTTDAEIDLVFAYHAEHFLAGHDTRSYGIASRIKNGFTLEAVPYNIDDKGGCDPSSGCCGPATDEDVARKKALHASFGVSLQGVDNSKIDCGWFRSGWFDKRVALWDLIKTGELQDRDSHGDREDAGGSVGTEFTLAPGASKKISVILSWYSPQFRMKHSHEELITTWYATEFRSVAAVNNYASDELDNLRTRTLNFANAIHKNDMPEAFRSAVTRNLSILKSPSLWRADDGRVWGWEGCHDDAGCCQGSCTHVYNYAQALAFLFPDLERGLREVELNESLEQNGFQHFRCDLPFTDCKTNPDENRSFGHAAADGQLGGIVRVYRDWRLSGENEWLRQQWPNIKRSLEYCIGAWDLERNGRLAEPHHNTYDIEFWGEDGLCSVIYAAALVAAIEMAEYLGESTEDWANILTGVRAVIKDELFDGWIRQKVHWKDLQADDPTAVSIGGERKDTPEASAVIEKEGPRYQYGDGVLIDAVLGCQTARIAGLTDIIDEDVERAHVDAIMEHNYKETLHEHACFQRPGYAIAEEGGTIMCSWPDGGRLTMPFPYSDEVWTGCEHQYAAHLVMLGRTDDALKVEEAVNGRYNGKVRNPFNEIECGHFYIRALASYGLVPAYSGAFYNAATQVMEFKPSVDGDFTSFFAIGSAWGHIGVRNGEPFLDLIEGELPIKEWKYEKQGALV